MIYACIKDGICVNALLLGEEARELSQFIIGRQGLSALVPLSEGFGVGDLYDGENWSYGERP